MIVPVNEYIEKMTEALELLILPRQSEKNTLQEISVWGGALADLTPEKNEF
jgi:hypothetical protein